MAPSFLNAPEHEVKTNVGSVWNAEAWLVSKGYGFWTKNKEAEG